MLPRVTQNTADVVILEITGRDRYKKLHDTHMELVKNHVIYELVQEWTQRFKPEHVREAETCFLIAYRMLTLQKGPASTLAVPISPETNDEFVRLRLKKREEDFFEESIEMIEKGNPIIFLSIRKLCQKEGRKYRELLLEFLYIYRLMHHQSEILPQDTERFQHFSTDKRLEIRDNASRTLDIPNIHEFS